MSRNKGRMNEKGGRMACRIPSNKHTQTQSNEAVSDACWLVMGQHQFAYIPPVYTLHECPKRPKMNSSIYYKTKTQRTTLISLLYQGPNVV